MHAGPVHRGEPGLVAVELLSDQVSRVVGVGKQGADLGQVRVDSLPPEHGVAPVVNRADGQSRRPPLEVWARAGERDQRGVEGRREVVDVQDLPARGGGRGGGDPRRRIDRPGL